MQQKAPIRHTFSKYSRRFLTLPGPPQASKTSLGAPPSRQPLQTSPHSRPFRSSSPSRPFAQANRGVTPPGSSRVAFLMSALALLTAWGSNTIPISKNAGACWECRLQPVPTLRTGHDFLQPVWLSRLRRIQNVNSLTQVLAHPRLHRLPMARQSFQPTPSFRIFVIAPTPTLQEPPSDAPTPPSPAFPSLLPPPGIACSSANSSPVISSRRHGRHRRRRRRLGHAAKWLSGMGAAARRRASRREVPQPRF
jgi:hypothetical protein